MLSSISKTGRSTGSTQQRLDALLASPDVALALEDNVVPTAKPLVPRKALRKSLLFNP
jgi:hypothetical protein